MELDHNLLQQVQRLISGANVHDVKTWIFCYETSLPSSPRREQYERLLREWESLAVLTLIEELEGLLHQLPGAFDGVFVCAGGRRGQPKRCGERRHTPWR